MTKNNFYITTTLPYVNSDPHLGFALELVQADVIARYHRLLGEEVFFNTGTDEHGVKIQRKAEEAGKDPQSYTDEYASKFKQLLPALGISDDVHFIRTTDPHHVAAAQEFWKLCDKNGDIYKKNYKVKYCVGCELEKTESDLDETGHCLIHPHLEIELIEEENYFFKFSKYEKPLLEFYEKNPDFVTPDFRFNEIKSFVKGGIQDFSISRLKSKMSWGVPVPVDEAHVMYVWFDALINYISTLDWPNTTPSAKAAISPLQEGRLQTADAVSSPFKGGVSLVHPSDEVFGVIRNQFSDFWPGLQIAGKDNLRQQSAMWQAMLMSAGLPNSKQIIIHGFINSGGQKMSKSLGNVADPYQIISDLKSKGLDDSQTIDALRYYLLREIPTFEDGDYTWEKFVEAYNAGLANGIGNLTSRILKMAVNAGCSVPIYGPTQEADESARYIEFYQLQKAMDAIWKKIQSCDEYIQKTEPFKKIKVDESAAKKDIAFLLSELNDIASSLQSFLPSTSAKILQALKEPSLETIPRLFPRI